LEGRIKNKKYCADAVIFCDELRHDIEKLKMKIDDHKNGKRDLEEEGKTIEEFDKRIIEKEEVIANKEKIYTINYKFNLFC